MTRWSHDILLIPFAFQIALRTEFKAYKDVKPVKPIKAPSQYKPPVEETSLETSYSATYKGEQATAHPTDNKLLERRRIRSLYSEPSKEPAKVRAWRRRRVQQRRGVSDKQIHVVGPRCVNIQQVNHFIIS